jgi:hypothetical protein
VTGAAGPYAVEPLGLVLDLRPGWPVETSGDAEKGTLWQSVPGSSAVFFLRWGPDEDVGTMLAAMADMLTTVSVVADGTSPRGTVPVRRVTALLRREELGAYLPEPSAGLPVHSLIPATTTRVVAAGLELRGRPVVAGYRISDEDDGDLEPALATALESVLRAAG